MKYLKIGMIGLITFSVDGMQKPYFRGDNKVVQMCIPYNWRDNQLEQGEMVTLCADLNNYKDGALIAKELKTSMEVIDAACRNILTQLSFGYIFSDYHEDRLGGNVLHVKTDQVYMATDWYMMVKYYYFGKNYQNSIRLASLIGLYDQNILLVPISIMHEDRNTRHKTSLNKAEIIYFEPHDYENDRLNESKTEGAL